MGKCITLIFLAFISHIQLIASENPAATGEPPLPAPLGPIIEVYGNGYHIQNGASSPQDYNLTDFGFEYVGERHTHYFTIHNTGDEPLSLNGPLYVSIVGHDRGEFEVRSQPSSTIAPGDTASFGLAFEPNHYGIQEATVMIYSNDPSHSPYSFIIQGGDDDHDSDTIYWYARCGMPGRSNPFLFLPLVLLIGFLSIRRKSPASTCAR